MNLSPPTRTAIVYDFDGTLAPGNIQEHTLIPDHLKLTSEQFWEAVEREKRAHDADQILVYLRLLVEFAAARGEPLTAALLGEHGAAAPLFEGVESWFARINAYAAAKSLQLEHYVISSGNHEMIRSTRIAHEFKEIYASKYMYDLQGHAMWPAVAINYTTKTQYLFRINKGIRNSWDNELINRWQPMTERAMPFQRMLFIGDGDTDIPSMKMVRHQGGHSIAVFDPKKWNATDQTEREHFKLKAYNLIAEDRAHFVLPADYTDGSQLDVTVRGVLGRIAREAGWRQNA
jgi:hypothetical protein